jgi:hypothetical protein
VVTVIVELTPAIVGVTVVGLSVHVAPVGCPLQVSKTGLLKPFSVVPVTVKLTEFPTVTIWVPGLAIKTKLNSTWPVLSKTVRVLPPPEEPPFATAKSGFWSKISCRNGRSSE